jgi:hypothetical protein
MKRIISMLSCLCLGVFLFVGNAVAVELSVPDEMIEYPEGTYKVGADLPAGIYFALAHWVTPSNPVSTANLVVKDGSGSDAKVLVADTFTDSCAIVEVLDGQYLTVHDAGFLNIAYSKNFLEALKLDHVPPGMFLAGYHFEPGEYKVTPEENASIMSFTIFADATQSKVLDTQVVKGGSWVTLKDGEYVRLRGARLTK